MPTKHHGKVRHLLENGKAVCVRRTPFTIRLLYDTPGRTQPVSLGVDAGSKMVGLSACTEKEGVRLFMGKELMKANNGFSEDFDGEDESEFDYDVCYECTWGRLLL